MLGRVLQYILVRKCKQFSFASALNVVSLDYVINNKSAIKHYCHSSVLGKSSDFQAES